MLYEDDWVRFGHIPLVEVEDTQPDAESHPAASEPVDLCETQRGEGGSASPHLDLCEAQISEGVNAPPPQLEGSPFTPAEDAQNPFDSLENLGSQATPNKGLEHKETEVSAGLPSAPTHGEGGQAGETGVGSADTQTLPPEVIPADTQPQDAAAQPSLTPPESQQVMVPASVQASQCDKEPKLVAPTDTGPSNAAIDRRLRRLMEPTPRHGHRVAENIRELWAANKGQLFKMFAACGNSTDRDLNMHASTKQVRFHMACINYRL